MSSDTRPVIVVPIQSVCAKCGINPAGAKGGKKQRHHPEMLKALKSYVPEWKKHYNKFRPQDVVMLCLRCHRFFEKEVISALISRYWYSTGPAQRTEERAVFIGSAASLSFWNWLETDSFAKTTQQLRWSDDPTKRDTLAASSTPRVVDLSSLNTVAPVSEIKSRATTMHIDGRVIERIRPPSTDDEVRGLSQRKAENDYAAMIAKRVSSSTDPLTKEQGFQMLSDFVERSRSKRPPIMRLAPKVSTPSNVSRS